ncbi:MAG TPA: MFS transporter [Paenibacillus sp.]|uniref:MFS transporter n=1 Tax=Paenibacillus sp. TaxID=58172 RepID=UPI0028D15243|nr:MFS transporter [Paenibacillus sp.]HUC92520.1 MFS transporter [Paenibacillus sp.]
MERKTIRAWIMYDWANSAFVTTMLAAVMPVFYESVAGKGLADNTAENYWGFTQTVATLLVALLSPVLGAIADYRGSKVRFLGVFMLVGALASVASALIGEGDWLLASVLVIIGTVGYAGGNTFYDALLTDLVPLENRDKVSAQGYAMGYIGGGLLLAVNVVMIQGWEMLGFPDQTTATQLVFVTVGIWWLLFSIPLFRSVKDRPRNRGMKLGAVVRTGFGNVARTFRNIRRYPQLMKYMLAYWFFNDGINTIILMATVYGSGIGIEMSHLIIALLITQFVGFPSTLLFGRFAVKAGAKRALYVSLAVYVLIVVLGYFMSTAAHFYALAIMVGLVQGGSQATARSIYANLVPPSRSGEFFGFLSLSSKFASIAGPFVFAVTGTITGSSRLAIVSLIAFFVIGIWLLTRVDLAQGRREALAHEPGVPV